MDPRNTHTLAQVIAKALDARVADMHVCTPARVVAYDSAKQSVDVQPILRQAHVDETGARVPERLPVVTSVPVSFPGGGGMTITFPIAVGDTGMLHFSEASLDKWLTYGGNDVDPGDDRRFCMADGMFVPGLRDFAHARASAPADHVRIGRDGAAAEMAALGETLQTFLNSLRSWAGTSGTSAGVPSVPTVTTPDVKVSKP